MRKLLVLAVTAVAALAFAGNASATQIEVTDETDHCSQVESTHHVVDGGCVVHATTDEDAILRQHVAGVGEVPFTVCSNEFDANIQEDGLGWIYNQHLEGDDCGITPCVEPNTTKLGWPVGMMEAGGVETLAVTFCLSRGVDIPCTIATRITTDGTHDYEVRASGERCSQNAVVSLTGHWNIEGTPIAINH